MADNGSNPVPPIATWLGRAGLIPFIAGPAALYFYPGYSPLIGEVIATYGLSIICFLVGIWWGLGLVRRRASALVISNAAVLTAFFGNIALATGDFLLLSAVLFPATVLLERVHSLFRPQPRYYARLRVQLTVVATLSLLLSALQV